MSAGTDAPAAGTAAAEVPHDAADPPASSVLQVDQQFQPEQHLSWAPLFDAATPVWYVNYAATFQALLGNMLYSPHAWNPTGN